MNKPTSPRAPYAHDHFFKMAMSDLRVAREFFEAHLPYDLKQHINLNCLEVQSGTFIDDMRQETIADMLFKSTIEGHEAYLYLVVDHQSKPDKLMPYRMLKYTLNIIDQHLKDQQSSKIPLILPLVVYHGKKPWRYSRDISTLVDAPKVLVEKFFLKPFQLIDLNQIDDEVIKQHIWAGVMELTLKHIYARDMLSFIPDIVQLLQQIADKNGKILTETVLIYILDRAELSNKETFFNLVKTELKPATRGEFMTIAEQLRAEGMQQGMQQGIEKEKQIIAERLLAEKMELSLIAKITELPLSKIQALKNKSH